MQPLCTLYAASAFMHDLTRLGSFPVDLIQGAHYCKRTAEKEIVTTCRADKKGTHYYAYDNTCAYAFRAVVYS